MDSAAKGKRFSFVVYCRFHVTASVPAKNNLGLKSCLECAAIKSLRQIMFKMTPVALANFEVQIPRLEGYPQGGTSRLFHPAVIRKRNVFQRRRRLRADSSEYG